MKFRYFLMTLCLAVVAFAGFSSTAVTQQAQQAVQNPSQGDFEYAQLIVVGNDQLTFDDGGNDRPRTRSLKALYAELGGRNRATLVNLLNEIGDDGWELVGSPVDGIWTFKR